jgi:hypothetical protein
VATKLKPETVQDVLDEMDAGAGLAGAMALAFAEIEAATKSATNPHFKSKYADLGAVIDAVKPPLIKYGLFFTQRCHPSEGGVCVETVLHYRDGDSMPLGQLFVPANKNDAQGFGSALTYARRYGLMTAFGVPAEDDDGNAARSTNGSAARPSTGEAPPNKRVKYEGGPYTCPTQLMTAAREFVRTLNSMGDYAEYIAWAKTDDVREFVKQLKREMPDWWDGGPSVPEDFVPLAILTSQKERDLQAVDEQKTRATA